MNNQGTWRVHLALLTVQVTFGCFYVFGKIAMEHIQPLTLAGTRVLFGTPLLLAMAWYSDRTLPNRKDIPHLALLGTLGVFLNQFFFILGLNWSNATDVSILITSIPIFTAAVGMAMKLETINTAKILGITLAVGGALVMLKVWNFTPSRTSTIGNLLMLTNCFCYSVFMVYQRRGAVSHLPPLTLIAWSFLFGGGMLTLVSSPYLITTEWTALPWKVYLVLAYAVVLLTAMNYALNTWAIRHSTPSLAATYTTLQPAVTAVPAIYLLGEQFTWLKVLGFLLILSGLQLVRYGNRVVATFPDVAKA